MKIISNFYDYYDKTIAYGIDPNLKYIREKKRIIVEPVSYKEPTKENIRKTSIVFDVSNTIARAFHGVASCDIICFCGKMYPVYSVSFGYEINVKNFRHYYSIESLKLDVFSKEFEKKLYDQFGYDGISYTLDELKNIISNMKRHNYSTDSAKATELDQYIGKEIGDDLFRYFDAPIIMIPASSNYDNMSITVNPILKDRAFIKVVNPYLAFQEISMYIGSNLAKQKDPEVKFSDELKAEIHGFDKMSFRKEKKRR